jgi:hypothetical protein
MKRNTLLTLTLLASELTACTAEPDPTVASFRALVVAQTWAVDAPIVLIDGSCEEHWVDRCAELSPEQCLVARNRYSCTETAEGVRVTDSFAELADEVEWQGLSLGDVELSGGGSAFEACAGLEGVDYEQCSQLAQAAESVAAELPALLSKFPNGGFASLTIRDDIFVVSPLATEGDLVHSTADKLGWRVPLIAGEFELSPGSASGIVIEDNVMVTVRPNGTLAVSCSWGGLLQRRKDPPLPPAGAFFAHYSMNAAGANYNDYLLQVVGGWARYAGQWKSYVDPLVGTVDLFCTYAGGGFRPLLGAEVTLDHHEATCFTDLWGTQYDPNGTWMSADIDDPLTGLAFAALVMHYWGSPVFFSGDWRPTWYAPAGSWYHQIALEQLTFQIPGAPDLHSACGISPNTPAVPALADIQSCNLHGVTIEAGVVSAWLGDLSPITAPSYLHHVNISGGDLLNAYAAGFNWTLNNPSGRVGELVFDPPAEAGPEEIAAVLSLAQFMADELREQVPLEELFE